MGRDLSGVKEYLPDRGNRKSPEAKKSKQASFT